MAWPASDVSGVKYTWDKTANTFERDVDQKLWAAMQAKSPILDMLPREPVDNFYFEWEVDSQPPRIYTENGDHANTTIDGSGAASNNALELTSVVGLEKGAILRNISVATPIGSYGQDEEMEVTNIVGTTVTLLRDCGNYSGTSTGSTAHDGGHSFEVIYTPKPEGSGPDANKYTDVTLVGNYANNIDFFLTVTGDQAATKRLVAGDTLENQFQKNLVNLTNQMEGMFFYGALNSTAQGSTSKVRRTKGFDNFVSVANANTDVATKDVTPAALDALFYQILEDKSDPSDRYIIACHPYNARKISTFGFDKVRTTMEANKYGRYVDTFRSDLGVDAPVIWSLNISKSDLFIIDMNKVAITSFRPFMKAEWNYGDDGVDAWRQRYLGSFGVKVVDPTYSHAKLGYLTWTA